MMRPVKAVVFSVRRGMSEVHRVTSSTEDGWQNAETTQVIRALVRHGLICHLQCYTTDTPFSLSARDQHGSRTQDATQASRSGG